jgi:hypothetical protein
MNLPQVSNQYPWYVKDNVAHPYHDMTGHCIAVNQIHVAMKPELIKMFVEAIREPENKPIILEAIREALLGEKA